jgi:hypothetical protein
MIGGAMKHALLFSSSKRKRQALALTYSASNTARFASLFVAGLAVITVEVTCDSMHVPLTSRIHYYAFAAACPAFTGALACFEKLNQGDWRKTLIVSWPWLLLLPTGALALAAHPHWPVLTMMALSTIVLDRVMLVRGRSKHL